MCHVFFSISSRLPLLFIFSHLQLDTSHPFSFLHIHISCCQLYTFSSCHIFTSSHPACLYLFLRSVGCNGNLDDDEIVKNEQNGTSLSQEMNQNCGKNSTVRCQSQPISHEMRVDGQKLKKDND